MTKEDLDGAQALLDISVCCTRKRKQVSLSKSKFQQSLEEFDLSHFAISGPYFVPHKLIQDSCNGFCCDGLRLALPLKFLKKAHEFGMKCPNVCHARNRVLIPDFLLGVDNYYKSHKDDSTDCFKLGVWKNISNSPPNNSLLVCNVGKRSFFIVWNQS
jgi:hypothetical protein